MNRFLLATIATVGLSGGALAADMPSAAPVDAAVVETSDWSGFFVGLQAGYSWRELDMDWTIGVGPGVSYSDESDDFVGGLYYGRNWQFGDWVLGIDSSISYIGVEEANNQMFDADVEANFLGLSRLKVGYAFDNFMIFAAGGLATTIFDVNVTGGGVDENEDSFGFGWTVGAGVETKLAEHWSARVEYIYAEIEDDLTVETPFDPQDFDLELKSHIVRAGVAYHF